jgi:hypothetical protein
LRRSKKITEKGITFEGENGGRNVHPLGNFDVNDGGYCFLGHIGDGRGQVNRARYLTPGLGGMSSGYHCEQEENTGEDSHSPKMFFGQTFHP